VLGNLYRSVTAEGHVKWVCIDHFRENCHEKAATTLCNVVGALKESFDENTGRVELKLRSNVQAEQFYLCIGEGEVGWVELDWDTAQSDFKKLRDTLAITNVGVLELYLKQQDGPIRETLSRGQRRDSVLDIMRHSCVRSFTLRGPQEFSQEIQPTVSQSRLFN